MKPIMFFLVCSMVLQGVTCLGQQQQVNFEQTRHWYVPDFIPLQFAGNIGFLSIGAGFSSKADTYQVALMYGYTPEIIANTNIHSVTIKNYFNITRIKIGNAQQLVPYLGLGLTLEAGGISFLKLPSVYPEKYYPPTALHIIAYGGFKIPLHFADDRILQGLELYTEVGSMDQFLWYKWGAQQDLKTRDIFSLAFGINFILPCRSCKR